MSRRIAVGISGGVDSCVAAFLLKEQGFDVTGVTLRVCDSFDESGARQVASSLGIPLEIFDVRSEFEKRVVSPFVREYTLARTPNPCVLCNREIKFGLMAELSASLGCDAVATGHYAFPVSKGGRHSLRLTDSGKDQSYFLCMLSQEQLERAVFPLAGMDKSGIRAIAQREGFAPADKKDSQEICFVPGDDYHSFLASRGVISEPGDIIDTEGRVIGRHTGVTDYTIGQRKGLGAFGRPMFVTSLDASANTVTIAPEGGQYSSGFTADSISFMGVTSFSEGERCLVKVRFRASPVPAVIEEAADGFVRVSFEKPERSVTPGQFAVFYDENGVLSAGSVIRDKF